MNKATQLKFENFFLRKPYLYIDFYQFANKTTVGIHYFLKPKIEFTENEKTIQKV